MAGRLSRRRGALLALAAAVTAVHLGLADRVLESRLGAGAADTRPRRIEIAFVRTLAPAAPPAAAPAPVRRLRRPAAAVPAAAPASAPVAEPPPGAVAEAVPGPPAEPLAEPPPGPALAEAAVPGEPAASVPEAAASEPALAQGPPPAASAAAAFEWPPSTRLSYILSGDFRGPVEGSARVEWLRSGTRYQVHLDVSVGPPFAPLVTRRLSSDGEITDEGLSPRRYDEETRVAFREARRLTMHFDGQRVRLANGRELPRLPGVQDTASQFVQLTWLFTMQPALLTPGRSVDIVLALPHDVDTWTYDVLKHERLVTPVGYVDTLHVKPRREPRPGVELTAEMWVAPSLQYLPVRIVIRQDAQTHVDLLIDTLPLQAAPAPAR
jgi:hypothetical protein